MPKKYKLASWGVLLLFCVYSAALSCQPRSILSSQFITTDDGLSQRIVTGISSDTLGTYYVQTLGSLHTIEGQKLTSTLLKDSYDSKFPLVESNGMFLLPDKNNCIWSINKQLEQGSKLCLKDLYDGDIIQFIAGENSLDVLIQDSLEYFYRRYVANEDEIISISEYSFHHDHQVLTALQVEEDQIFIINDQDELYNIQSGELIFKLNGERYLRSFEPSLLKHEPTSSLFFSLHARLGIFRFKNGQVEIVNQNGFIRSYGRDQKGNLLIGVERSSYLRMDELIMVDDEDRVTDWSSILETNDRVITYYGLDFEKAVLLGTHTGLYYHQFEIEGVNQLMKKEIDEGSFGYIVRSFTCGHNNHIVTMTETGSTITELIDGEPLENAKLTDNFGSGINWVEYVAEEGLYYIGQFQRDRTSSLTTYNPQTDEKSAISFPMALERFHILDNEIWVTGKDNLEGRVYKINRNTGRVTSMFEELNPKMVRSSYFTDSVYLFGTRAGLLVYDAVTGTIDEDLFSETEDLAISNIRYYDNQYLLGTYNDGIHVYNSDFKFVRKIVVGQDPSSNTVASIERDHHGNYWVSTFQGISILNDELRFLGRLDRGNGYESIEYNRDASFVDGQLLLFGHLNGYNTIDPDAVLSNLRTSKLFIEECEYDRQGDRIIIEDEDIEIDIKGIPTQVKLSLATSGFTELLRYPRISARDIRVEPSVDDIQIEGHEITLSGLGAKNYQLFYDDPFDKGGEVKVAAVNINRNFDLILGMTCLGLLMAFLSFFIARSFIRTANKRNAERLELAETKMKALRSQLNPHFVFNSLNSIQYYIQVNEKRLAKDYLAKFGKLMRLFLEASHNDTVSLKNEIAQLQLYLELEKVRFENRWNYNIEVDQSLEVDMVTIPAMILQPILENSIIHGLGHRSSTGGLLNLVFEEEGTNINVSIVDNGVGRERSREINSRRYNKPKSLSTSITQERIQIFNNYKDEKIDILYQDLYDGDNNGAGTHVTVKFKNQLGK